MQIEVETTEFQATYVVLFDEDYDSGLIGLL
jgi:hypothetical protein